MKSELSQAQVLKFFAEDNWDKIQEVKRIVKELDSTYIDHTRINGDISPILTIVMTTTPKRKQQTLFTLKTIKRSTISKQLQVVVVEDSTTGKYIEKEKLEDFGLFIDHVKIKNKFWVNPCVNYNIGFKSALSERIIIQNGEVCHVGDICLKASKDTAPGKYLVFDVIALQREQSNTALHLRDIGPFCKLKSNFNPRTTKWYQHHKHRNANLHFLTSISSQDLKEIGGGFDLDYSMATCFDDPAFINQLKSIKIQFVNVPESNYSLMGIHQWHGPENPKMILTNVQNQHLLIAKEEYQNKHNKYPFLDTKSALYDVFKKKSCEELLNNEQS
jgi:hypothetical protein